MSLRGIDVHPYYQRDLDFHAVKREGNVSFAWVKVSDGGAAYRKLVDQRIYVPDIMVNAARRAGMLVGGYHYAQKFPSPEVQADVLTGEVRRLGALDIPPALDLEAPFVPGSEALEFAVRFLRRMLENGFDQVALYASTSMLGSFHVESYFTERVSIWVANPSGVPGAYKNKHYSGRADVHQYAQESIPGSNGIQLDLNHIITRLGDLGMAGIDRAVEILESLNRGATAGLPQGRDEIGTWAAELRQSQANTEQATGDILAELMEIKVLLQTLVGTGITLRGEGQIVIRAGE